MKQLLQAPERGINIVCLLISAAAPVLAIGPIAGGAVGMAATFGLLAAIKYQADPERRIRQAAYGAVWLIRLFIVSVEQMAYEDVYSMRDSLPFGWTACTWAWITPVFMAALDLLAYGLTAARAAAAADAAELAAGLERADRIMEERAAKIEAEQREAREQERAVLMITAETERLRIATEAAAMSEAAKAKAESRAAVARSQAEAASRKADADRAATEAAERKAEAERKRLEVEREKAEAARRQAEADRKTAELARNQAEARQKQEEADRSKAEAAAAAAAADKRRRWTEADAEERGKIILLATEEAVAKYGANPTQQQIAEFAGVSDRTIRDHQKTISQ